MIGSRRRGLDAKKLVQLSHETRYKLRTSVTYDLFRQAMMFPHIVPEEPSKAFRRQPCSCGNEMHHLAKPVNSDHDGVIPLAFWQTSNEINCYDLPYLLGNLSGNEGSGGHGRESLCPTAPVTALDIGSHISGDARPPVIPSDQLKSLPSARVTSDLRIMMSLNNSPSEFRILWYIDFTPEQNQTLLLNPLSTINSRSSRFPQFFHSLNYTFIKIFAFPDFLQKGLFLG